MGKLLNLDELVPENRTLIYKGVQYEVGAIPLRDYLAYQRESSQFAKSKDEGDQLKAGMRAVSLVVPTLPADELQGMNLRQIKALMEFVGEVLADSGAEKAAAPNPQPPVEQPASQEQTTTTTTTTT